MPEPYDCSACPTMPVGSRRCHCMVCHEGFAGVSAFDAHRIGKHGVRTGPAARRCATIEEMRAGGLLPTPAGWSMAADAERARRFRERVEKASRSGGIGSNRRRTAAEAVGAVAAEAGA